MMVIPFMCQISTSSGYLVGITDLQPNFMQVILYNSVNPHQIPGEKMHFNEQVSA